MYLRMRGTGCFHHDDCLTCPFVKCLLEVDDVRSALRQHRQDQFEKLASEGLTHAEISKRLGVAKRTIARYAAA